MSSNDHFEEAWAKAGFTGKSHSSCLNKARRGNAHTIRSTTLYRST